MHDIQEIYRAADAAEEATTRLRQVVVKHATAEAANITLIAEAAGVTRQTVYRWVAETGGDPAAAATRNPGEAMDEALEVLIGAGVGPLHELLVGIRSRDLAVKARRVRQGLGNMGGRTLSEQDMATVGVGATAASTVLASLSRAAA